MPTAAPELLEAVARILASRAHRMAPTTQRLLVEDCCALVLASKPEEVEQIRAHIAQTVKEAA
jgi:hypothetical protein